MKAPFSIPAISAPGGAGKPSQNSSIFSLSSGFIALYSVWFALSAQDLQRCAFAITPNRGGKTLSRLGDSLEI
jgi:hypothetical protein